MVIGCLCGLGTAAQAEDKRIGVVDLRKVVIDGKAGQQSRAELEKMVKEKRDKLAKDDAAIKKLQEAYEKDQLTFTDKQKEQKQKELEEKMRAMQKTMQDAQQEVNKRENELSQKARAIVGDIIADIAKQEKLAMVVDKNQPGIVWLDEPVDITERVAKAYEAKSGK